MSYKTFELSGNTKTNSGDQIEEWIHPQNEQINKKMKEWDWNKPFEFEMPEKPFVNEFDVVLEGDGLPEKIPELGKFSLYKSSKLTDFIKGSFLEQYGLILSKKAKNIFEQFNIGKHKFYPITLHHNRTNYDYYFLKSLTNSNEYIDIKNSIFYSQKGYFNSENRSEISFENIESINEFSIKNSETRIYIFADSIKLTEDFPNYDFFSFSNFGIHKKFLSKKLACELETLSGIILNDTELII